MKKSTKTNRNSKYLLGKWQMLGMKEIENVVVFCFA